MVKVILWPWPKVVYKQKFKPDFLRNYCADLNPILYESLQVQNNRQTPDIVAVLPIENKNPKYFFSADLRQLSNMYNSDRPIFTI